MTTVFSRYSRSSRNRPAAISAGQIRVRRGNHAHVDENDTRRSDLLHFAGLQHAQQLRLQTDRHVRDLVEEQRAFVGELEQPDAILAARR